MDPITRTYKRGFAYMIRGWLVPQWFQQAGNQGSSRCSVEESEGSMVQPLSRSLEGLWRVNWFESNFQTLEFEVHGDVRRKNCFLSRNDLAHYGRFHFLPPSIPSGPLAYLQSRPHSGRVLRLSLLNTWQSSLEPSLTHPELCFTNFLRWVFQSHQVDNKDLPSQDPSWNYRTQKLKW